MTFAEWLYERRPTPTNAIFWRWRKAEAERKALKHEVRRLTMALRDSREALDKVTSALRRERESQREGTQG